MKKKASEHFNFKEHLLLDSAFTPADNFIPAYKKPRGLELNEEQFHFNFMLKRPRSTSEHCIGAFKGRFPFLKSIRFMLEENEESVCKNLNYINVCAVLHNFLLMENESGEMFYEDDGYTSDLDADNELNHPVGDQESHATRRSQLTAYFAESSFVAQHGHVHLN